MRSKDIKYILNYLRIPFKEDYNQILLITKKGDRTTFMVHSWDKVMCICYAKTFLKRILYCMTGQIQEPKYVYE